MDRLRKRRDFLAAAKAQRAGSTCFLVQGRDRSDAGVARYGLTVTKKTGNAVVRNRIRRRLREVVRRVLPQSGQRGYDYVLVAREAALRAPFDGLVRDLERAIRKLHAPADPRSGGKRPPGAKRSAAESAAGRGAPPAGSAPDRPAEPSSPAPGTDVPGSDSKAQAFDPQAPNAAHGGQPA